MSFSSVFSLNESTNRTRSGQTDISSITVYYYSIFYCRLIYAKSLNCRCRLSILFRFEPVAVRLPSSGWLTAIQLLIERTSRCAAVKDIECFAEMHLKLVGRCNIRRRIRYNRRSLPLGRVPNHDLTNRTCTRWSWVLTLTFDVIAVTCDVIVDGQVWDKRNSLWTPLQI